MARAFIFEHNEELSYCSLSNRLLGIDGKRGQIHGQKSMEDAYPGRNRNLTRNDLSVNCLFISALLFLSDQSSGSFREHHNEKTEEE